MPVLSGASERWRGISESHTSAFPMLAQIANDQERHVNLTFDQKMMLVGLQREVKQGTGLGCARGVSLK